MKELVIDGMAFEVEQAFEELTLFGPRAAAFITDVIKAGLPVMVSEIGYQAEVSFTRVLEYGQKDGAPFVRVDFIPLRLLNGAGT